MREESNLYQAFTQKELRSLHSFLNEQHVDKSHLRNIAKQFNTLTIALSIVTPTNETEYTSLRELLNSIKAKLESINGL